MDGILLRVVAVVVGGAELNTWLRPAAGHEHRETVGIVVAPVFSLRRGRAPEFATPEDESILKQAPLFQIGDEACPSRRTAWCDILGDGNTEKRRFGNRRCGQ